MKTAMWRWILAVVFTLAAAGIAGAAVIGDVQTATLYVTVDGSGAARELEARNFRVWEDGVAQKVLRDRKSTRLNSSHIQKSRMPSSA